MAQEKTAKRDRGDIIAELIGVSDSLFILSQLFTEEEKPIVSNSAIYGALFAARTQLDRIVEDLDKKE